MALPRSVAGLILAAAGVLPAAADDPIRVATFNASLNRAEAGALIRDLTTPANAQARRVAAIIQRVRPDVLLIQEFDYDAQGAALAAFKANYLQRAQEGSEPIAYAHSFSAPSNTGVASGFDLDRNGHIGGGGDALGFGEFPGQYGMVVLSRFPIDARRVRTFKDFLWRDMPGAIPPPGWYSDEQLARLPLSSKSHWDVPVKIPGLKLHLLASHPTPPAFDGEEDRNGRRNHDEVRFWRDYLDDARYLRDDTGRAGGLRRGSFVILGDLNSDPIDGASLHEAIKSLLTHARVNATFTPRSAGAVEAAAQGGANSQHRGDAATDTADFNDRVAGNLRVDYLLPSSDLRVCDGGVFWPRSDDPDAELVWGEPAPSSDHRLVWLDITRAQARCPRDSDPTTNAASHPRR